jgi:hypothetical protein
LTEYVEVAQRQAGLRLKIRRKPAHERRVRLQQRPPSAQTAAPRQCICHEPVKETGNIWFRLYVHMQ